MEWESHSLIKRTLTRSEGGEVAGLAAAALAPSAYVRAACLPARAACVARVRERDLLCARAASGGRVFCRLLQFAAC